MKEEPNMSDVETCFDVKFTLVPAALAPEVPTAKGHKESPVRTAVKGMKRGEFLFIPGASSRLRKRISDMVSRTRRLTNNEKQYALREITVEGVKGLGVWRIDLDPKAAKAVDPAPVNWPRKTQLMSGR